MVRQSAQEYIRIATPSSGANSRVLIKRQFWAPVICVVFSFLFISLLAGESKAIVGGKAVDNKATHFDAVVAIYNTNKDSICTGVMIHPRVVLTAAHCLFGDAEDYLVIDSSKPGDDLKRRQAGDSLNSKFYSVEKLEMHPDYLRPLSEYEFSDIGIVILKSSFRSFERQFDLELNPRIELLNQKTTLVGFGYSKFQKIKVHRNDPRLQGAIDHEQGGCNSYKTECFILDVGRERELYSGEVSIVRSEISEIVLDESNGVASCYGDSGGPAFVEIENIRYLVGINSRSYSGKACGNDYGIKTRVSYFLPWIREKIQEIEK